jgi:hypothetical protein
MSSCLAAQCSNGRCLAALESGTYARPLRVLVLLVGLCLTSAAQGATITVHPEDNDGRIFVDIAGEMTLTDIKTFSDKIEHLPSEKVYVSLSSEGGDAVAVVIGNYIRLSGMKTLVPKIRGASASAQLSGLVPVIDMSVEKIRPSASMVLTIKTPASRVR